jgi:hypothetical protein
MKNSSDKIQWRNWTLLTRNLVFLADEDQKNRCWNNHDRYACKQTQHKIH